MLFHVLSTLGKGRTDFGGSRVETSELQVLLRTAIKIFVSLEKLSNRDSKAFQLENPSQNPDLANLCFKEEDRSHIPESRWRLIAARNFHWSRWSLASL
jgi:hypothetical protein